MRQDGCRTEGRKAEHQVPAAPLPPGRTCRPAAGRPQPPPAAPPASGDQRRPAARSRPPGLQIRGDGNQVDHHHRYQQDGGHAPALAIQGERLQVVPGHRAGPAPRSSRRHPAAGRPEAAPRTADSRSGPRPQQRCRHWSGRCPTPPRPAQDRCPAAAPAQSSAARRLDAAGPPAGHPYNDRPGPAAQGTLTSWRGRSTQRTQSLWPPPRCTTGTAPSSRPESRRPSDHCRASTPAPGTFPPATPIAPLTAPGWRLTQRGRASTTTITIRPAPSKAGQREQHTQCSPSRGCTASPVRSDPKHGDHAYADCRGRRQHAPTRREGQNDPSMRPAKPGT